MKLNAKDTKRVYHLNLLPEHISNDIFLVGDQKELVKFQNTLTELNIKLITVNLLLILDILAKKE